LVHARGKGLVRESVRIIMLLPKPVVNHGQQLNRLYQARQDLPGDIAEFGVYNGGSTAQMAQWGRKVWAFDTFEGLPKEDRLDVDGPHTMPGKFTPTENLVELWRMFPNVVSVKGRFIDTLPIVPVEVRFMLVYIDCDYQQSFEQVLGWLPGRLVPGAVIVIDDYTALPGVRTAVDEFVAKHDVVLSEKGEVIEWPK
jgi:predicted O-methyltransferase YrrM